MGHKSACPYTIHRPPCSRHAHARADALPMRNAISLTRTTVDFEFPSLFLTWRRTRKCGSSSTAGVRPSRSPFSSHSSTTTWLRRTTYVKAPLAHNCENQRRPYSSVRTTLHSLAHLDISFIADSHSYFISETENAFFCESLIT